MKKFLFGLMVFFSLSSLADASVYLDSSFCMKVAVNSPVLRFDVWRFKENGIRAKYNNIAYINIFDSATGDPVQKIDESNINPDDAVPFVNFEFDDYNFDGFVDLYLTDPCAVLGNCHGFIFLFGSGKNVFEYSPQYTGLTSVSADKDKKLIYSVNRSGAGAFYTYETFKISEGKLILTEALMQSPMENGKFHFTHERLNSEGVMEVITDEIYDEPRFPFETEN